ncbi:hypothetical protein [Brevundimonas sp.]|uniref:hypothetical protein n=1 Tax=Brevundimonas sp. TaxID=1871086 RepID=UPI00262DABD8|nr:hypothetical protein [Brevundimonas sp.]
MRTALFFAAVSALALGGCASIQPARMALPQELASTAVTLPVTGIGGGRSGLFRAGSYSGRYSRSDERIALFDPLFERRDGRTDFELTGPEVVGSIRVACRAQERTVTLGVLSVETQPMAFGCDISSAGSDRTRLEVRAYREGVGGRLMRHERRGEITLDGASLQIRSVHDVEGSGVQLATPIGYVFELDGIPVGAVEINGSPVIRHVPEADPSVLRALTVAAIALGLFWDPAESALGREAEQ